MAKIGLKRKKSTNETYLEREKKCSDELIEKKEHLLKDRTKKVIDKNNELDDAMVKEEAKRLAEEKVKEEAKRLAEEKAKEEAKRLAEEKAKMEELKRQEVKATEVKEIVSDELATHLIEEEDEDEVIYGSKKGIINIDTISRNFKANDIVTINLLKKKKLIDDKICFIKVLARGTLNKALTIKAHDFSLDAVKMIELTGGKVVKLKKNKE